MAVDFLVNWAYPALLLVLNSILVFTVAVSLATFFYFAFIHEYLPGKSMTDGYSSIKSTMGHKLRFQH